MTKAFGLFFLLLIIFGCKDDQKPQELPFEVVLQREYFSMEYAQPSRVEYKVIQNNGDWQRLLGIVGSYGGGVFEMYSEQINFSKHTLIAVLDSVYSTGGHSIDVTKIIDTGKEVDISIENLTAGTDVTVISRPFQVVKTNKITKKVRFIPVPNPSYP